MEEEEEEGADGQGAEFIISSLESMIGSRPVHMPGHPESVPVLEITIQFHASLALLQVVPRPVHEA